MSSAVPGTHVPTFTFTSRSNDVPSTPASGNWGDVAFWWDAAGGNGPHSVVIDSVSYSVGDSLDAFAVLMIQAGYPNLTALYYGLGLNSKVAGVTGSG